jgi:hypothetical protein
MKNPIIKSAINSSIQNKPENRKNSLLLELIEDMNFSDASDMSQAIAETKALYEDFLCNRAYSSLPTRKRLEDALQQKLALFWDQVLEENVTVPTGLRSITHQIKKFSENYGLDATRLMRAILMVLQELPEDISSDLSAIAEAIHTFLSALEAQHPDTPFQIGLLGLSPSQKLYNHLIQAPILMLVRAEYVEALTFFHKEAMTQSIQASDIAEPYTSEMLKIVAESNDPVLSQAIPNLQPFMTFENLEWLADGCLWRWGW